MAFVNTGMQVFLKEKRGQWLVKEVLILAALGWPAGPSMATKTQKSLLGKYVELMRIHGSLINTCKELSVSTSFAGLGVNLPWKRLAVCSWKILLCNQTLLGVELSTDSLCSSPSSSNFTLGCWLMCTVTIFPLRCSVQ